MMFVHHQKPKLSYYLFKEVTNVVKYDLYTVYLIKKRNKLNHNFEQAFRIVLKNGEFEKL